jgi:hypothetical protein
MSSIEQRFGMPTQPGGLATVDAAEFDPFGAAYQAAVATVDRSSEPAVAQLAPPASSWGVQTFDQLLASSAANTTTNAIEPPSPGAPTQDQIDAAIAGVAAPVGPHRIGGYGSMPIPTELEAYGNGRIPVDRLVPIGQGSHRLFAPAAESWKHLVDAAASDGITMRITDSYRTYDQQVDLAQRKGLFRNGGLAAVPGTSNHGWGLAVDADVRDPATMAWLRANGPRFGWVEANGREPWHWEFRPNQV